LWSSLVREESLYWLLVGGLTVTLKEGKGSLDTNLCFKDNSSFVSSKKFWLGLEDISGSHIQGAITDPFPAKDARGKCKFQWILRVHLLSFYFGHEFSWWVRKVAFFWSRDELKLVLCCFSVSICDCYHF
jgi:hypothetical protein